jgi:rRNA small subunit pseudouridine methyltransferase Nep1
MISLILAEAELELIPNKIFSKPAIVSQSKKHQKKSSQMILDASFHHSAMRSLPDWRRRGRPDIAHIFLLTVLESIANKKGLVKDIIIHTRNDEIIYINPETRIMRNYTRFIGLIEQLYQKEIIATEEKTLLSIKRNITLVELLKQYEKEHIICFSETGKKTSMHNYLLNVKADSIEDIVCIIGGFPMGTFHTNFSSYIYNEISIYPEPITAWTTANEVLVHYQYINKS